MQCGLIAAFRALAHCLNCAAISVRRAETSTRNRSRMSRRRAIKRDRFEHPDRRPRVPRCFEAVLIRGRKKLGSFQHIGETARPTRATQPCLLRHASTWPSARNPRRVCEIPLLGSYDTLGAPRGLQTMEQTKRFLVRLNGLPDKTMLPRTGVGGAIADSWNPASAVAE